MSKKTKFNKKYGTMTSDPKEIQKFFEESYSTTLPNSKRVWQFVGNKGKKK